MQVSSKGEVGGIRLTRLAQKEKENMKAKEEVQAKENG